MDVGAETHPGCFVATLTFQDLAFDRETRQQNSDNVRAWRLFLLAWLEEIAAVYPPRGKATNTELADAILALTYGGMTLAKALGDGQAIGRQALMFRETVRLHFQPG